MIQKRIESARGCGYRKPGGIYLVGAKAYNSCAMLPFELQVCPCCGAGVKPSRGWTWVSKLLVQHVCPLAAAGACGNCQWRQQEKLGLLWIGESFYRTPAEFIAEASMAGVSRRISAVPRDFKVGESWVMLAHRKAFVGYKNGVPFFTPGVFAVFRPSAIEYVVTGSETPEKLKALEKRGFTLVDVTRDIDAQLKFKDQLSVFSIKYLSVKDGLESHKIVSLEAFSKTRARKQFKIIYPGVKIISIK